MLRSLIFLAAVGCAASSEKVHSEADTGGGDPSAEDTSGGGTLPDGLNGVPPDEPVALPRFAARNQYGDARSDADLLGQPAVLWFYPAAGTYG